MVYLPVVHGVYSDPDLALHRGFTPEHVRYNLDVKAALDRIKQMADIHEWSQSEIDAEIKRLQNRLRDDLRSGRKTCA